MSAADIATDERRVYRKDLSRRAASRRTEVLDTSIISVEEAAVLAVLDVATQDVVALREKLAAAERTVEEYRGVIETYGVVQTCKDLANQMVHVNASINAHVFVALDDPRQAFTATLTRLFEEMGNAHRAARYLRASEMRKPAGFFDVANLGQPPALPCPRCGTPTTVIGKDGTCSACKYFPSIITAETTPNA